MFPFSPLPLAFRGHTYAVTLPSGELRQLLRGISGFAQFSCMLALMGASSAGKTTLLDVQGGRKNSGTAGGAITIAVAAALADRLINDGSLAYALAAAGVPGELGYDTLGALMVVRFYGRRWPPPSHNYFS